MLLVTPLISTRDILSNNEMDALRSQTINLYQKRQGTSNADVDSVTNLINPGMDGAADRRHNLHELTYPTFK